LRINVSTNTATHFTPIDTGHGDIETYQVVGIDQRFSNGIATVEDHVNGISLSTQAPSYRLSQIDFIVNNQYSHATDRNRLAPFTTGEPQNSGRKNICFRLYGDLRSDVVQCLP